MHVVAYLAHADDEVLGCGGLLAKLAAQGHRVSIVLATDGLVVRDDGSSDNTASALRGGQNTRRRTCTSWGFPTSVSTTFP